MKNVYRILSLATLLFFVFAFSGQAQDANPKNLNWIAPEYPTGVRADPDVFLQGDYVEVGVHEVGSCGTSAAAPAGYHNWPAYGGQLGFVADYGRDGWAVGSPPYSGDYFVPGSPEERWVLEWNVGATERNFTNAGLEPFYGTPVPQTSLVNTSVGTVNSCVWTGTATVGSESILVTQNISFNDDDLYFVFNITLKNVGTVTLESVEYMRNVDPDQGLDLGCSYTTSNYVKHQPGAPGSGDTALVVAKTLGCGNIPLGLGTINPNAVVSTEGFTNTDPDEILDSPVAPTEAAPNVADEAIALAFRFASLAPGQSINFSYVYILNDEDLANLGEVLPPPNEIPISDWALAIGIMLILAAAVIRIRRFA
jgi:hypothetical protein